MDGERKHGLDEREERKEERRKRRQRKKVNETDRDRAYLLAWRQQFFFTDGAVCTGA